MLWPQALQYLPDAAAPQLAQYGGHFVSFGGATDVVRRPFGESAAELGKGYRLRSTSHQVDQLLPSLRRLRHSTGNRIWRPMSGCAVGASDPRTRFESSRCERPLGRQERLAAHRRIDRVQDGEATDIRHPADGDGIT